MRKIIYIKDIVKNRFVFSDVYTKKVIREIEKNVYKNENIVLDFNWIDNLWVTLINSLIYHFHNFYWWIEKLKFINCNDYLKWKIVYLINSFRKYYEL